MTLVVDASVAVKWSFREEGQPVARALLSAGQPLIAPDLLLAEVGNAAWKRLRRAAGTAEQARNALLLLPKLLDRLVPIADLAERAAEIGIDLDHPIYDCFYLALAERERTRCVTADQRLLARLRETRYDALIRPLAA